MASKKKMWVAFRGNTTIAAGVMGEDEVIAQAGEPIHVPYSYGKHVTDDKFADECDAPKKEVAEKPKKPTKAEKDAADLVKKLLSDAKSAVEDAEKKVEGVKGKGDDLEKTAGEELAAAQDALKALEDPDAE